MTELTVIQTGEVVEQMTAVEAERITSRIADKLDAIADNLEQVLPLIGEALTREAWKVLGYASPTAYVSERFAGALTRLSPEVRRPVVAQLSEAGMSTRTIAPLVGRDQSRIARDLQVMRSASPAITPPSAEPYDEEMPPDLATMPPLPASRRIIGADNKTYTRPEPKETPKPRRRSLTDTARDLGLDIKAITDRAERFTNDDRFAAQKSEVASHLRHHLAHAIEVLTDLNDQIN